MTEILLEHGDRVRTNAIYAKRFPRCKPKAGMIVGAVRTSSKRYRVLWDGWSNPETVHLSLLDVHECGVN